MRIDKFLSNMKYGTRKEIQKLIKKGNVTVNGIVVKKSGLIINQENDIVKIYDEEVKFLNDILVMMNKPSGYLSSKEQGMHKNIYELLGDDLSRIDLEIAGRLDIDTEGLLLLTDNGKLLHDIITPNKNIYKKYYVEVSKKFDYMKLEGNYTIKDGIGRDFFPSNPLVELKDELSFYLSIHEGKYHQVKRMIEHFSSKVTYLKRVQIGNLILDDNLKLGEYKIIDKTDL